MKIGLCSYSGYKIYPGHGRRLVKTDGKVFNFLNSRCLAAHLLKRNPRECRWTVLYRRKHKKGAEEETVKKRTRKTVKYQRAIAGTSLTELIAKRNQKPEVRKAAREQAIRAAKEKQRALQAAKKPAQVPTKKPVQPAQKAAKVTQKTAPRVGGKR
ncbi:60S ribosomal protein L24-like [Tropilaelaps mercedesae]|uniref:Large ribosomal subunit protein eL24 n=1 Tax=Tropilaelaps mercedesae TaxID=418985 RepID=A0A1V9X0I4_9ACAR|nr:60S ribosomal protein L24-like [Tropilaelaps mercedesae]